MLKYPCCQRKTLTRQIIVFVSIHTLGGKRLQCSEVCDDATVGTINTILSHAGFRPPADAQYIQAVAEGQRVLPVDEPEAKVFGDTVEENAEYVLTLYMPSHEGQSQRVQ